ncbi:MAG: FkbM family methyltransferase [bacterium]
MKRPIKSVVQNRIKALLNISPRLKFIYDQQRRNRNLFREPVQTPFGFKFCGNKGMESGGFEQEESCVIQKMLGEAELFINIGANIGYYACIAASMGKKVVAFEPDIDNCRLLYKNIYLNKFDELVEIFPIALAERAGLLNLFGFSTGASLVNIWNSREDGVLVPVHDMDTLLAHRVVGRRCLFLLDVEGAEHLVLRGGKKCIAEADAKWVVEIMPPCQHGNQLAAAEKFTSVFRLFSDSGFSAFLLSGGAEITQNEIDQAGRGEPSRITGQVMFGFSRK